MRMFPAPRPRPDPVAARAADWFVRQRGPDMDEDAWLEFSDWLGADPRHAEIYDQVVEADGDLTALAKRGALNRPAAVRAPSQPVRARLYLLAGGIAAAVVAAISVGPLFEERPAIFTPYQTAIGERREVKVAPGITVAMNGATRLSVSDARVPVIRLESGEAAFVIDRPEPSGLRVEVAGLTLVDKGTVFDVVRDDAGVRVGVERGLVTVNPEGRALRLKPGETLTVPPEGAATRGTARPGDVTGWRDGRLAYDFAPATRVAADLSRSLGLTVELSPAMAEKRFTGVIRTDAAPVAVVPGAAALLGGRAVRTKTGWRIEGQ